jgi:hypothetical protein
MFPIYTSLGMAKYELYTLGILPKVSTRVEPCSQLRIVVTN